jgi:hypothetical protein
VANANGIGVAVPVAAAVAAVAVIGALLIGATADLDRGRAGNDAQRTAAPQPSTSAVRPHVGDRSPSPSTTASTTTASSTTVASSTVASSTTASWTTASSTTIPARPIPAAPVPATSSTTTTTTATTTTTEVAASAALAGRVVARSDDGEVRPMAAVRVTLRSLAGADPVAVVTTVDGRWSFEGVAAGSYAVLVRVPVGFRIGPDQVGPWRPSSLSFAMAEQLDVAGVAITVADLVLVTSPSGSVP